MFLGEEVRGYHMAAIMAADPLALPEALGVAATTITRLRIGVARIQKAGGGVWEPGAPDGWLALGRSAACSDSLERLFAPFKIGSDLCNAHREG